MRDGGHFEILILGTFTTAGHRHEELDMLRLSVWLTEASAKYLVLQVLSPLGSWVKIS